MSDTTTISRAELALIGQRLESLAAVVQASDDAIIDKTVDGFITSWSKGAERIYGYVEAEVIGRPISLLAPEGRKDEVRRLLARIQAGEQVKQLETTRRRKDGQEVNVSLTILPLTNADGAIVGATTLARDITERVRAEAALKAQRATLEAISSSADALIFSLDRKYRYTSFNQAHALVMKAIYGADIEIGQSLLDLMTVVEDRDQARRNLDRVLAGEQIVEESYSGEQGLARLCFKIAHCPIRAEDGSIIGVVVFAQDVTERKRAEETRLAQIRYYEHMDRINRVIREAPDLDRLMSDVLGATLAIFGCDRAWLLYPCDPDAPFYRVPMEVARPEYPGAKALNVEVPMSAGEAETLREALQSEAPVTYVAGTDRPVATAKQFGVQSQMFECIRTKSGKPWVFGIHQCSHPRVWTPSEMLLFQEIGRRLGDGLTSLLILRGLQESEENYRTLIQKIQAAVVVHGPDTRILVSNSKAQELLGMSEAQLLGKTTRDPDWHFLRDDGTDLPLEEFPANQVFATRQCLRNLVVGVRRLHQSDVWVLVSADPVLARDGEIAQVITTFVDITRRRQTERITMARLRLHQFAATHTLDELLEATLDEAEALSDSLIGFYHFLEADQRTLSLQNWSTRTKAEFCTAAGKGSHYDVSAAGVWVDCIHQRRPVIHNDYLSLPHRKGLPPGHAPVLRELVVPVFRGERIVAILGVGNKAQDYTTEDIEAVSRLADLAWDITERKRSETEIARSNRALRMLSDSNQTLFRAGDEATLLSEICRVVVEMGGYRLAWVGFAEHDPDKTLRPVAHAGIDSGYIESARVTWGDDERGQGPGGIAIRTGLPCVVRNMSTDPSFAPWMEAARKRGYNSVIALPLICGGETLGALGVYSDQTDAFDEPEVEVLQELAGDLAFGITTLRTRAAREQAESRLQLFRQLTNETNDAIFVVDPPTSRILDVNETACRMLGYTRQELLTLAVVDFDLAMHGPAPWAEHVKTLRDVGSMTVESRHRRRDGSTFPVEVGVRYALRGDREYLIAVSRDITERRSLQAQLQQSQKMEAVGQLAGGVAHDFNNKLAVIIGYAELMLQRMDRGDPYFEEVKEIHVAAQRSADLTRQLLAFARRQTVTQRVLDLNEVVGGMLRMLTRLIGEDISLTWLPGAGLWPIKMDPSQIDQILANLTVNARDAIAGVGRITIETSHATLDQAACVGRPGFLPGEYVVLTVTDSGCGMNAETLARIFEPFFTTKEQGKGTGLGLATVYGIVRQNSGFCDVRSEPGRGTAFCIYLPRNVSAAEPVPIRGSAAAASGGHETLLVVEDESSILGLAKRVLNGLGYRVLTAAAPSEALCLAEEHEGEIHLLVTDVVMPGMNGLELHMALLARYPAIKHLFMSGYSGDVIAHHGILNEGVHFIQKPFSIQALAAKVREALE